MYGGINLHHFTVAPALNWSHLVTPVPLGLAS
ncbi:hypothetical protein SAMN05444365_103526 [Micromonospora pattaloongensis]|uniref:Uncharacterized protein n=1 Tax=Micromonospora pattaloongensis TaxID=405436 RepID=A0A1H3MUV9_9ACTN|nr:hypothetical protein SAMN05444365_103526 [Micromonospora pattaloongensis]